MAIYPVCVETDSNHFQANAYCDFPLCNSCVRDGRCTNLRTVCVEFISVIIGIAADMAGNIFQAELIFGKFRGQLEWRYISILQTNCS